MDSQEISIQNIRQRLEALAAHHGVSILYACESGSRAWGFPSADSDYDIRFIYLHPRDWYLSIHAHRDVIDPAIEGLIDMGGWDLRKSLRLLQKGNASLVEWLNSPIVYLRDPAIAEPLDALAREAFRPETATHHYLALARRTRKALGKAERWRLKDVFYALRAVLCARHIIEAGEAPPVPLTPLLEHYVSEPLKALVEDHIRAKLGQRESDTIAPEAGLEAFLEQEQAYCQARIPKNPPPCNTARFDALFLDALASAEAM